MALFKKVQIVARFVYELFPHFQLYFFYYQNGKKYHWKFPYYLFPKMQFALMGKNPIKFKEKIYEENLWGKFKD